MRRIQADTCSTQEERLFANSTYQFSDNSMQQCIELVLKSCVILGFVIFELMFESMIFSDVWL